MTAKKTPNLILRAVEPEGRRALGDDDKRLIACEKPYPDAPRLTVFLTSNECRTKSDNARTTEVSLGDLIAQAATEDDAVIELIVEMDEWTKAISPYLAALRDRLNHPLIVHTGDGHRVGGSVDQQMVSLGFTRQMADEPIYLFDIETYKRTPDWLNARHWANPELWDKYRW
ncbi:DUF6231 family protein [Guyparkeria halophila]|uniref:DUF6231 family protein n=1 Tax=Guyparkeria halophila TaxID=47960 RepID=A0ABZ0YTC0_9GAMM|nr:DUF6231 family protein [Guyparkeria halophila]WQH15421.1 DUF6231 family protein [Guyparkeria halophila]